MQNDSRFPLFTYFTFGYCDSGEDLYECVMRMESAKSSRSPGLYSHFPGNSFVVGLRWVKLALALPCHSYRRLPKPRLTLASLKHKTLDVITLFHKASSPASVRVQTLLKQTSAIASETATEDQASDHSHQTHPRRKEFELDVTEAPPTEDQLKNIIEYLGASKISSIVKGAKTESDALKKLKESGENFQRPVVSSFLFVEKWLLMSNDLIQTVDWETGRAVLGENQSEILKLVEALPTKK